MKEKKTPVRMSTRLRELIAAPGIIRAVNIYDPCSARIAEQVGFEAVLLGAWALGTHLCTSEVFMTLTEMTDNARLITKAVDIPLILDCGAGFGEPIHVMRTMRETEATGSACIYMGDLFYPERAHYFKMIEHLISPEEMIDKIKCAVAVRRDPDVVIMGRTDAMRTDSVREGIRRSNLYAEAGCDMMMVFPNNPEEARLAAKEIHAPVCYVNSPGNPGGRPVFSWQELEEMGYRMVLDSPTVICAAVRAIHEALSAEMKQGRPTLDGETARRVRDMMETDLQGLPELYRVEEETTERMAKGR